MNFCSFIPTSNILIFEQINFAICAWKTSVVIVTYCCPSRILRWSAPREPPPYYSRQTAWCRHQVSLSWQVTDGRRFDLEWDAVSNKERSSWGLWDIPARGLSLGHTWSISPPGEEAGEFSNTSYLFWQTATTSFHTFAIFSFRLHCSWAPIENDLQMSLLFYAFAFFYVMLWLCIVELFQSKAWSWWRLFLHCN